MATSAVAARRPTRNGPIRSARRPTSGPATAPSAAPTISAAPMCQVGTPFPCRCRGTSRSIAPSEMGSIDREDDGRQHEAVAQHGAERADVAVLGRDLDADGRAPGQRIVSAAAPARQENASSGEVAWAKEPTPGPIRPGREQAHDDAGLAAEAIARRVGREPGHRRRPGDACRAALQRRERGRARSRWARARTRASRP